MKNVLKIVAVACLTLLCASCKKENGPAVNEKACFVTIPDMEPLADTYSCSWDKWKNKLFVPFDGDKVLDKGDFVTIEITGESKEIFDYMTAPADDHGLDGDAVCYGFYPVTFYKQGQTAAAKIIYDDGTLKFEKEIRLIADYWKGVDLGLSVKWAPVNVGAEKMGDFGSYFQWGDPVGYGSDVSDGKYFGWSDLDRNICYKWSSAPSMYSLTKYCTDAKYGEVDNKTLLDPKDDAASVNWGEIWRMPTSAEWQELFDNCNSYWDTVNGVDGYVFQSKVPGFTDASIFLPACGLRDGDKYEPSNHDYSRQGFYWASDLSTSNRANIVVFDMAGFKLHDSNRIYGYSVRAVKEY